MCKICGCFPCTGVNWDQAKMDRRPSWEIISDLKDTISKQELTIIDMMANENDLEYQLSDISIERDRYRDALRGIAPNWCQYPVLAYCVVCCQTFKPGKTEHKEDCAKGEAERSES